MSKHQTIILLALMLFTAACEKNWDEHFNIEEESVNKTLWESIKENAEFSDFVNYAEIYGLDSMIKSPNPITLFIPDNDAFSEYLASDTSGLYVTMRYLIVNSLFQVRTVVNSKRIETYTGTYALLEYRNNRHYFDETEIIHFSPLYQDGKYYEIAKVVEPKLSLYEYLKFNNPAFAAYIDTKDSIVLDREQSEPLGYDDLGRTIYDSVTFTVNLFEEEYFKISEESRSLTATLALPDKESFEAALNEMASNITSNTITDHEDIPTKWQHEILMPGLLHKGVYGGSLDPSFFEQSKFTNVIGDSIFRDFEIDPDSRIICSNGIIYNYKSYAVADSLYLVRKVEGESLVEQLGVNQYTWIEELTELSCFNCFQPIEQEVPGTSNDSVIDVTFTPLYAGEYSVSFYLDNVFPGSYRGVWRSNYITSGVYNVYVNDVLVVEQFDTRNLIDGIFSVDPSLYKFWPDGKGFNQFDFLVDIEAFGSVKFTLEYTGPGSSNSNGLVMDFIGLFSFNN